MTMTSRSGTVLTTLDHQIPPFIPQGAEMMTAKVELPPGEPMLTLVDEGELAARARWAGVTPARR
ncbi:hypothetical protein E1267_31750 [Nonomuraea longispora]|uniref:Uncharacterized protein n=1 Tax=Nonomuraea longispora TaxID=1848320 RepID=A0A4R4MZ57_9ACTN|nr:hypothetical protein [Nonomuraea longispora]TDC01515.1 hypothetical protein E1267_31750 [Nonomuraea longispora]